MFVFTSFTGGGTVQIEVVNLVGVFIIGGVCGSLIAGRRRSARRPGAEPADDSGKVSRRVDDVLTVLGAPLFDTNDNQPFTTEERVQWIQARVG
jgi:hypothetical protein